MGSILAVGLYESNADPQHKLGEKYVDKWGRTFRYVQAGAVDLVTGNLIQEAAEDTNYRSMVVQAASAAGSTTIAVTLGGTAVTANQFESGDLLVESSTGIGQVFKIVSHSVQTSTTGTCTFQVDRPVETALTTSSQVSVRKSSYDDVIQSPVTTQTGRVLGVAIFIIVTTEYGWIQSGGDCGILMDAGTNSASDLMSLIPSVGTAGSGEGSADTNQIGQVREAASVDSTINFVTLNID